ncbi:hypothetical protein LC605_14850 [Nostoc sp. CHAB 5836]|uniref:hypothetical protein n=1 Tax=Nostoc sp. CHAB 5836 TaxID=2780404 RepID=UPI001E550B56|nr:hypothetical protein [Nostoc sp. CHAB 5836]MCC5616323.1 hypothetical protein [Nostoc sp. CHAB 5836]
MLKKLLNATLWNELGQESTSCHVRLCFCNKTCPTTDAAATPVVDIGTSNPQDQLH